MATAVRTARAGRGEARPRAPAAGRAPATTSACAGTLRPAGPALRGRPGAVALPGRRCPGDVRRARGAFDAASRSAVDGRVRPRARVVCARRRLADGPRWHGRHRRRPRRRGPPAGRRHRDGRSGRIAHRSAGVPRRHPRHDAACGRRDRRRPSATQDAAAVRALPLWPRRLQGRLGAVRAGAMDRGGRRTRRDGPSRRDHGRSTPLGAPGRHGPAAGSPVHAVRAVRGRGIRHGRRRASTPRGRIATCRPGRRST